MSVIPDIKEIRAISDEANETSIIAHMEKIRTGLVNGIQQDARSGYRKHYHTFGFNTTVRASENFHAACDRLAIEFADAHYDFTVYVDDTLNSVDAIEIKW